MYGYVMASVVASLTISYQLLKLPKQNVNTLRKLLLLEDGQPRIFGHRGGQYEAPENTVLSIETAAKNGATAVEIDLEFTKDDETMSKMCVCVCLCACVCMCMWVSVCV